MPPHPHPPPPHPTFLHCRRPQCVCVWYCVCVCVCKPNAKYINIQFFLTRINRNLYYSSDVLFKITLNIFIFTPWLVLTIWLADMTPAGHTVDDFKPDSGPDFSHQWYVRGAGVHGWVINEYLSKYSLNACCQCDYYTSPDLVGPLLHTFRC